MREKEAIEAERKSIARNLEKQAKAIEKLVETERSLVSQTVGLIISSPSGSISCMFRQISARKLP